MEEYSLIELSNGVRVIFKPAPHSKIGHAGIIFDLGSRDEEEGQEGYAHFWEHMAFKGTTHRRSIHIINSLEKVGGELNAYTTREKICFYASFLQPYLSKAIDVLSDISFNSVFPEKEIEKERQVILEEMAMYQDTPDDSIQDDFDLMVFKDHPFGKNILGTKESLEGLSRDKLVEFINQKTATDRIVLSIVGNYTQKEVKALAEKYLAVLPAKTAVLKREPFSTYRPISETKNKPVTQAHVIMGRDAFALNDPNRLPFFMLVNILGGPGMNSRLNMALREKNGLVYSIEAQYTPYLDSGQFQLYFATEPGHLKKALDLTKKELKKLREVKLTSTQLQDAKNQLKGQLAMSEESNLNLMLVFGKSILDNNRVESLNEIFAQIDAISSDKLCGLAQSMLDPENLSVLTYLPEPE